MKLLRYGPRGQEKPGMLDAAGAIRDLSGVVADIDSATLAAGGLAKLKAVDPSSLPKVDGSPRIGACVGGIGKVICIGLNYSDHAAETGAAIPKEPIVFLKAVSSVQGPDDNVHIPRTSVKTDWEVELGVVIGKTAKYVSEADALSVVAGYSCYNDGPIRDYQRHTSQFVPGKSFYHSGAFGPWMVTADEIPDPATLTLITRLNGEEMQRATTDDLLFSIPQLIAYLTDVTELVAGDVIVSGTTGGVGFYRKPQVFMKQGDTIEVELDKIGILSNPIRNEV